MTTPLISAADLVLTDASAIDHASALIRAYCRWHIAPSQEDTLTLDTGGGSILLLPTQYLTAVDEIVLISETETTLDPTRYLWSETGYVRRSDALWLSRPASVRVTFTHGYADVPDAIRAVAVSIATRLPIAFASVSAEAAGGVSKQYGGLIGGQAALSAAFTAVELMVLDRYRIPTRP